MGGELDQKDEKGERVADQEDAEWHRQLLQTERGAGLLDLNAGVVVLQKAEVWSPFTPLQIVVDAESLRVQSTRNH